MRVALVVLLSVGCGSVQPLLDAAPETAVDVASDVVDARSPVDVVDALDVVPADVQCVPACFFFEDCVAGRCVARDAGMSCVDGGLCTSPPLMICGPGCCVDTSRDSQHCGLCGNACRGGAACVMGRCDFRCAAGTADCDGRGPNGCESPLAMDPANCGMCGRACPTPPGPHAAATCAVGMCFAGCQAGWGSCDGIEANGCEQDLSVGVMDPREAAINHCGACGVRCTVPVGGGNPTCTMGRCGFTCGGGTADCDGNTANGCETNTVVDPLNCGACGRRCSATTPRCVSSTCAP